MDLQQATGASPPSLERRRFQRWELNAPARVCAAEVGFAARCLDVSLGGALLRVKDQGSFPRELLVYLYLDSFGAAPVPIVARLVEADGRRLRVAFDPLPAPTAVAITLEVRRGRGLRRSPSRGLPN